MSRRVVGLVLVVLGGLLPVQADIALPPEVPYENMPYDGRFTFNRLRFTPARWGPGNYAWGLDLQWNHDYPRAESHLVRILGATTTIDVNLEGSNILALDDPELFRYPVAYLCEPGHWTLTDEEARDKEAIATKQVSISFRTGEFNLDENAKYIIDREFVDIAKAFESIARQINQLRLTQ